MKVVKTVEDVRNFVNEQKKQGKSIGLVPTMGFLHKGHRSLIERARKENDAIIVSIFVNPTQFGPNEDYDNYPKDLESDMKMCEKCGVDLIFNPNPENIYEMHHKTYINVEDISGQLCGLSRPTHFRGVCTIVAKLFNISKADRAYFGQKDAQQLAILKKMVKDLNFDIELIACPIVREKDGLAMSSRNKYLTELEREDATVLYRSIQAAKAIIKKGVKAQDVVKVMSEVIAEVSYAKIDYIQIVDAEFLQPVDVIDEDVLVALAVYIGKARLIDNFVYEV